MTSLLLRYLSMATLLLALGGVLVTYRRISRLARDRALDARAFELLEDERDTRRNRLPDEQRTIVLRIGATSADDLVEERRRVAASPANPMAFQYFQVGSSGDRNAFDRDFTIARFELATDCDASAELVVSEPTDGRRRVLLLFSPPLTADAEWTVECRVPGMWDPLRTRHADSYDYRVNTDTVTDLSISFTSRRPIAVRQHPLDAAPMVAELDAAAGETTRFRATSPTAGTSFRFDLAEDGFEPD